MGNRRIILLTNLLVVAAIAKVTHEINRAYRESIGEELGPTWEDSPDWQKDSVINGVKLHLSDENASTAASHESWLKQKTEEGWKYGPVKDVEAKEHPCFLPYAELPESQKAKYFIFKQAVHSTADFYLDNIIDLNDVEVVTADANEIAEIQQGEAVDINATNLQDSSVKDPVTAKLTRGQKAVGITFNPSLDPQVDLVKQKCADVIDAIEDWRDIIKGDASPVQGEKLAQSQLAIRDIQSGQMWAVKAITLKP